MIKYKFRAECWVDYLSLLAHLPVYPYRQWTYPLLESAPDIVITMEIDASFDEIIEALRDVEDSHVMIQTLELEENYTGERDYARE